MALTRGHHFVYDTHYHIVFPVKYRKALLESERGNWKVVEQYVKNQGKSPGNTMERQLRLW